MKSATFYSSTGADDGYGTSWEFKPSESNIIMGPTGSTNGSRKDSFVRFTNVVIPRGATILTAYLRFKSNGNYTANVCRTDIYFIDAANPSAPASYADFKNPPGGSAVVTTEKVLWTHGDWVAEVYYDSPDITEIVQEVVSRPDWVQGNAMMACLLEETRSDWNAYRSAYSYEADGVGVTLYVEFEYLNVSVVIESPPNVREIINRIAYEASSMEYWDSGQHNLVYLPTHTTVAKSVDATRIDLGTISIGYTDRVDLLNSMTLWYQHYWAGYSGDAAFRKSVSDSDDTSIAKFGTLKSEPLPFKYLGGTDDDDTNVQRAARWILTQQKNPRVIVEFTGGYYLTDLKRSNLIQFSFISGDELDKAFSGRVTTSDKFIVTDIARGVGWIRIKSVQLIPLS